MLLLLSTLVVWWFGSILVAPEAKAAVAVFESHYHSAQSLQAQFLEEYREQGRITRSEAGTVYFQKPGKMRWDYAAPENTLFLVDGKNAWFYVPADHTVMRVPVRESSDWRTPLSLLAGEIKLSRICERVGLAKDEKPSEVANVVLYCKIRGPKADSQDRSRTETSAAGIDNEVVFFEIQRATGELFRVQVKDPGGVIIEFQFKNWQLDPHLARPLFHFSPPRGVAIVNGELPSADTAMKP